MYFNKMNVVTDGQIHSDFKQSSVKKIRPVIWSHGNMGNTTSYTGLCKDLASYGYIVFAIGHADGSSAYMTNRDGPVHYNTPK